MKKQLDNVNLSEKGNGKAEFIMSNNRWLDTFILQNSSLNNELTRNGVLNNLVQTDTDGKISLSPVKVISRAARGKNSQVITMSSFFYGEDADEGIFAIKDAEKITAYDRRVYNAMSTLYFAGRITVSLNEIYGVMTGYGRKNPTKSQMEVLEKSLKKLSYVNVSIDITEELNENIIKDTKVLVDAGFLKNSSDTIMEDKMLVINIDKRETKNGKVFTTVEIQKEPVLFTYNRAKKTLINIPMQYIGLSSTILTEKIIAFQDYLLMRIMGYKNRKMNVNKILYNTLYKDSGEEKPENSMAFIETRNNIKKMMDEWKNGGLISSYKEIKEGRSYVGIVFEIE